MRILVLTPWFPVSEQDQSGNFILDSVRALSERGADVNILVAQPWIPHFAGLLHRDWGREKLDKSIYDNEFKFFLVRYFSIPRNYFTALSIRFFLYRAIPALNKQLEIYEADVIHAHTEFAGFAALKLGEELGIPVVVTLHGVNTAQRLQNGSYKKLLSFVLNRAAKVVMVGTPLVKQYSAYVENTNNFTVVHNGFRVPPLPPTKRPMLRRQRVRFISVSNLHEGKGIDLNLVALSVLDKKGMFDWSYTVIGDGKERKTLEKQCMDLEIYNKVKFLGERPHYQVYKYLCSSDVFILPSYREAFGIAYLEAMACGLLTIGVEYQGASEFIENNKTGFLVPPKDIDALIRCLVSIYQSNDLFFQVAERGRCEVIRRFTWENHAKKLIKLFHKVIEVPSQ